MGGREMRGWEGGREIQDGREGDERMGGKKHAHLTRLVLVQAFRRTHPAQRLDATHPTHTRARHVRECEGADKSV